MEARSVSTSPEFYSELLAFAKSKELTDEVLLSRAFEVFFSVLKLDDLSLEEGTRLWQEYLDCKNNVGVVEPLENDN